MIGFGFYPISPAFVIGQAVTELQVQLNRWARYLGVAPLEVSGTLDSKTQALLYQVAVTYAPAAWAELQAYAGEAASTAESTVLLVGNVTGEISAAGDALAIDVVVVPPEEGTLIVEEQVQLANASLLAAGIPIPMIPSRVRGGATSPWVYVGLAAGGAAALGVTILLSRRGAKKTKEAA